MRIESGADFVITKPAKNTETLNILMLTSKYLMSKARVRRPPNTVWRPAFATLYYMEYLTEENMLITDVYKTPYNEQTEHFVNFLY